MTKQSRQHLAPEFEGQLRTGDPDAGIDQKLVSAQNWVVAERRGYEKALAHRAEVARLAHAAGWTKYRIAKRLGLTRRAVDEALAKPSLRTPEAFLASEIAANGGLENPSDAAIRRRLRAVAPPAFEGPTHTERRMNMTGEPNPSYQGWTWTFASAGTDARGRLLPTVHVTTAHVLHPAANVHLRAVGTLTLVKGTRTAECRVEVLESQIDRPATVVVVASETQTHASLGLELLTVPLAAAAWHQFVTGDKQLLLIGDWGNDPVAGERFTELETDGTIGHAGVDHDSLRLLGLSLPSSDDR